jgi:ferredoxin-thioredoxin reductase catalytic chain
VTVESRKRALQYFYAKVVDALGYKFTPDEELKDFLLEQEARLEQKHGIPFCPCQPITGERAHDMTLVCPCN